MSVDYTSTANIASVKRRAMLPDSQQLYSPDEICAILTEELFADIVPLLMAVREEYMVQFYDQTLSTSQSSYEIPGRAIGTKLRDAVLLNSNGLEVSMQRMEADHLKHQWWTGDTAMFIKWVGFLFQDDKITIYPNTSNLSAYQLRMKYFRRPNKIVTTSNAGQITIINTGTKTVTLSNAPSTWTTSLLYDVIKGSPSFRSRGDDNTITAIDLSGKTMTFTTLPTGIAVGDWVAVAGESPIAQIPWEIHQLLDQRAAFKILEALGDPNASTSGAVYKDMVDKFRVMVTPRADGSPKRIVRNSHLFGGQGYNGNWR